MEVTFKLQRGPWDGQTISSASSCEVTADFARLLYALSRCGMIGAELPLVSPAGRDRRRRSRQPAQATDTPMHRYQVAQRETSDGVILVTAIHLGAECAP